MENKTTKKIYVASKNPVKIEATRQAFQKVFEQDVTVEGVGQMDVINEAQPLTDRATYNAALLRLKLAHQWIDANKALECDFIVSIEGGVDSDQFADSPDEDMMAFAWILVADRQLHKVGRARTGSFFLPQAVSSLVKLGKELGEADDIVFGCSQSKTKNGCVGLLTNDLITRTSYYANTIVLSLIPFLNPSHFLLAPPS